MQKLAKMKSSLTKNWPGGRRNATITHNDNTVWNNAVVNFSRPYVSEEGLETQSSQLPTEDQGEDNAQG